ncbi:MAG: hypothetical protein FWE20_03630 [Defluviitaleaceae bacterium]|nr:hypothetical protein [Defluviitaleaceae bacterium]
MKSIKKAIMIFLCFVLTVSMSVTVFAVEPSVSQLQDINVRNLNVRAYHVSDDESVFVIEIPSSYERAIPGTIQAVVTRQPNGAVQVVIHNRSVMNVSINGNIALFGDAPPFNAVANHLIVNNVIGAGGSIPYTVFPWNGTYGGGVITLTVTPVFPFTGPLPQVL